MSAARKKPAPPDMGGLTDDWNRLATMRQQEHAGAPDPAPAPAEQPRTPPPTEPEKTRRSWYVDKAAAEEFQAAVDDIHHATRAPKHEVASRLLRAATARADEVADDIKHTYHA